MVAPGAEGLCNLLPYTGRHIASLCNQAIANREVHAATDACDMVLLESLFPCACVQYRCVKCSRSMDVAHNFGERMPHKHRTGDGSYMPCSSTLLPYAMWKLLHNAASFDLLPPGVELDKTTLRADVAYCVRVDELTDPNISCGRWQRTVEGTWLGAELLTWGSPVDNSTTYEVRVFKAARCRSEHAQRRHAADGARQGAASAGSAACCQRILAAGSVCCQPRLTCSA